MNKEKYDREKYDREEYQRGFPTERLCDAIVSKNHRDVEGLLKHGANPNIKAHTGYFPIEYASAKGDIKSMELLKKYGAKIKNIIPNKTKSLEEHDAKHQKELPWPLKYAIWGGMSPLDHNYGCKDDNKETPTKWKDSLNGIRWLKKEGLTLKYDIPFVDILSGIRSNNIRGELINKKNEAPPKEQKDFVFEMLEEFSIKDIKTIMIINPYHLGLNPHMTEDEMVEMTLKNIRANSAIDVRKLGGGVWISAEAAIEKKKEILKEKINNKLTTNLEL
jgi:hypothetical protein